MLVDRHPCSPAPPTAGPRSPQAWTAVTAARERPRRPTGQGVRLPAQRARLDRNSCRPCRCSADPVRRGDGPPRGPSPRPGSGLLGARAVEQLQQVVRRQLHVLVAPLGRAVDAGDQPGAVDAAEIAVHEGVAGLRLLRRPLGEAEVPFGVLVPGVGLQEGVLLAGAGLDGAPVASEDVLVGRDQAPGAADAAIAPGSFRVAPSPRRPSGSPCRLARCGSGDAVRLSRRPVDPMSTRQRATELLRVASWGVIEQELAHALTRWWRAHPG